VLKYHVEHPKSNVPEFQVVFVNRFKAFKQRVGFFYWSVYPS